MINLYKYRLFEPLIVFGSVIILSLFGLKTCIDWACLGPLIFLLSSAISLGINYLALLVFKSLRKGGFGRQFVYSILSVVIFIVGLNIYIAING